MGDRADVSSPLGNCLSTDGVCHCFLWRLDTELSLLSLSNCINMLCCVGIAEVDGAESCLLHG